MDKHIQRLLFRSVKEKRYDILSEKITFYHRSSLSEDSILFEGYENGLQMLSFLLAHGINPNEQNDIGDVVLNYAAADNNLCAIEELLRFNVLLDIPNIYGEDAFSFACVKGSLESAEILYKNGTRASWIKKNWNKKMLMESGFIKDSIKIFLLSINILN